jgi:hypothetical protein
MAVKIKISYKSEEEQFNQVYLLEPGYVFEFTEDFASLAERFVSDKPEEYSYSIAYVRPGTELFTIYGPNHVVVIDQEFVPEPKELFRLIIKTAEGIIISDSEEEFSSEVVKELELDNVVIRFLYDDEELASETIPYGSEDLTIEILAE